VLENEFVFVKKVVPRMNIFFLDFNPRLAAEYHCDKHVVKMILETAQLLYSVHWMLTDGKNLPADAYRKTHANHPCAIWARESLDNYLWLADLGWWLCKEYQHRYGEHKQHKTERHIVWLRDHAPCGLYSKGTTLIRLAMPDEYKKRNPVEAYRTYYRENKVKVRGIVTYSKRDAPAWIA
jgi:hypothetical protein